MRTQGSKFLTSYSRVLTFLILFLIINSFINHHDSYSSESTALEALKKGKELYENGDFDKSIDELKKAISEFKELKLLPGKIKEGFYEAYLYTGLNYLGKGEEKEAKEFFREAIMINPSFKLDPDQFSPKVISLYTQTQATLRAEIKIVSSPSGADVFIDNKAKGSTPILISDLIAGEYDIKVSKKDYKDWISKVSLTAGKSIEIHVSLIENPGSLSITSKPSGARVLINNQFRGVTPLSIENLSEGEYSLSISYEGFSDVTQKAIIKVGKRTEVAVELQALTGSISISSEPGSAQVFLDGELKGVTPLVIEGISLGQHLLKLVKEGHEEARKTITVKKDVRDTVLIQMKVILIASKSAEVELKKELRKIIINEKDSSEMVLIPAGEFTMGSDEKHIFGLYSDEKPVHKVFLDNYYIDKYEISAPQFAKFLNERGNPDNRYFIANPFATIIKDGSIYKPRPGCEKKPANSVTWEGASEFAKWAGKRLPAEAEWEKAARGADGRKYPWGNSSPDSKKANYSREWVNHEETLSNVDSHPEGISPYGIYNMAGNVFEWIADWYDKEYYSRSPYKNPAGPESGNINFVRGGSWLAAQWFLRATFRYKPVYLPLFPPIYHEYGFRCVKSP